MIRLAAFSLGACLLAGQAHAHSFESGADLYAQFIEGIWVIIGYPQTLLPLLSLGILLSLWHSEGMLKAWPVFLVGQIAGIGLGAVQGEWAGVPILAAGILAASIAAILTTQHRAICLGLAAALGALALGESLAGHGFFELPLLIYAGILFGTNLTVGCSAALASMAMEKVPATWMRLGWRVTASWLAAIMLLMLAFAMRSA